MKNFAFLTCPIIFSCFSQNIFARQYEIHFYAITMQGLEKYSVVKDTLTLEIDKLSSSKHKDLEEKDLVVGREIKGNYEIWYLKILDGRYARIGDYKMLVFENRGDKNAFGTYTSGTFPTLELCEYSLFPKPSDLYYFTCYTKTYFDTFQNLASFADADEKTAKAVFEDRATQMNVFLKERTALKSYRLVAFQNFLNEALLKHTFNPVMDEKVLNDVMVKYHIKY